MREVHYYSNYVKTHDIDCFFKQDGLAFHFASNGQPLPKFILRKKNTEIQATVYKALPNAKGEVFTNWRAIRFLINRELNGLEGIEKDNFDIDRSIEGKMEEYALSFQMIARLGFISMDLDEEGVLHIIAAPKGYTVSEVLYSF